MATKTSSRDEIRTYQQELNSAGANPPLVVDGIWGPKTEAANVKFGASLEGDAPAPDALIGTGPEGTEPRFGLSGGAQLWKNTTTGDSFIVYDVPGTEDAPMYMRWSVATEADVQSFFGPGQAVVYQGEYADDDSIWGSTVDFGSSDDIANTSKSPFDSWASTMATEAETKPWILDADYQQLLAMSVIEKRPLDEDEIARTEWWRTHNPDQRRWMKDYNFDPLAAEQRKNDERIAQTAYMRNAGMGDVDERLANYLADQVTMGNMSRTSMQQQVTYMSDPYYADQVLDPGLDQFMADNAISFESTSDQESEVRSTVKKWLGTNFGAWDDETVSEWAGKVRNDPNAQEVLVETLKDQKQALFPEYDREASYQTISAPWRTMMQNMWGELPDDSDAVLQSVIRMNDAGEAGKYLTTEGMNRGNDVVVNKVQNAVTSTFGGI